MKNKSIVLSVLIFIIAAFSGVNANAQAMLQGNPSMENFIGSPGMWVITTGVILMIVFILLVRKIKKLIPEPVLKKTAE